MAIFQQPIIRSTSGLVLRWGWWGLPIKQCHLCLRPTDSRCYGTEIWDKTGCNLAFIKDICKIFASLIQGRAVKSCKPNFTPTGHCCRGNKIWDKMGYNSASVKDICKIFASIGRGVLGLGRWTLQSAFSPTFVAMAMKFETKWATTRPSVRDICEPNFFPTDTRCHGNEIWDKMGYNSASVNDMSRIFSCSCSSSNTVVVVVVVVSALCAGGVYIRLVTV